MRLFFAFLLPLVFQLIAYLAVFMAARGGGSFMGLLAMPVAAFSFIVLIASGIGGARGQAPLPGLAFRSFLIALLPPIALLVFRALES